MGNSHGKVVVGKDVDMKSYVQSEWRSQRSNELDSLGGLGRPALALGQSFNAKMQFLGEVLMEQGEKMQEILAPVRIEAPRQKQPPSVQLPGVLHTERRAAVRKASITGDPLVEPVAPASPPVPRFLSQAEYQKVRKAAKAAAIVRQQEKPARQMASPAEWRRRMHASRRNVALMVRTMVLLKRGHKHPRRMLRFSSLGFYIPQLLAEDCSRFVAEQQRYAAIRRGIAAIRAELDELLRAEARQGAGTPGAVGGEPRGESGRPPDGLLSIFHTSGGAMDKASARNRRSRPPPAPPAGGVQHAKPWDRSSAPDRRPSAAVSRPSPGPYTVGNGKNDAVQVRKPAPEVGRTSPASDGEVQGSTAAKLASVQENAVSEGLGVGKLPSVISGPAASLPVAISSTDAEQRSPSAKALLSPTRVPTAKKQATARNPGALPRPVGSAAEDADSQLSAAAEPTVTDGRPALVGRQLSMPVLSSQTSALADSAIGAGVKSKLSAGAPGALDSHRGSAERATPNSQQNDPADSSTARQARMETLRGEHDKLYEQLKRSSKLMGMYINRVNGAWAEGQSWAAPRVTSAQEVASWLQDSDYNVYKADVLCEKGRQLRQGQIAVQLLVADDTFTMPQRGPGSAKRPTLAGPAAQHDLWTLDLWELIETIRPGILPSTARIEGLSFCGRALCELALAVQQLAGPAALEKLHIILHVTEEQEEDVLEELHAHHCYGLSRTNVILVVCNRHPGYFWHAGDASFGSESSLAATWSAGACLAATASGQHPSLSSLGTGAALCQLAWAGEAFTVGEDGQPAPLDLPLLEHLEAKKIDWMISRRARDMALLTRAGVFDLGQLAHAMHLRDKMRASCLLEVVHAGSAVTARVYDSIVMHPSSKSGLDMGWGVAELRQSDIVSPQVIAAVEDLRASGGGKGLTLGTARYLFHVPTIKSQLTSLAVFRPRLSLNRHLLHVSLDMADLMVHDKGRALAVETRAHTGVLSTPASLEALLPLLQAQDHDPAFRDLVMAHMPLGGAEVPTVVAGVPDPRKPGHPIIVFLVQNPVAATAVKTATNLARPGRDCIQLVHIVPTSVQVKAGEDMLAGYKRQAMRSMVEVTTHVIVRKASGLLECMERFVADSTTEAGARPLVVMGSVQLTSHVFTYMAASVALSATKRLAGTPVLILTQNTKQIPAKPGMRCLALVEAHSRNMVSWACNDLLDTTRGDRLLLSQVAPSHLITRQQAAAMRRLLENFHTLAYSHQTPIHKVVAGEGPVESVLCEQVEEHGAAILALQLPPGTKTIPAHLIALMRSCRGATLIYQDGGTRQSAMRKSMSLRRSVSVLANARMAAGEAIVVQDPDQY